METTEIEAVSFICKISQKVSCICYLKIHHSTHSIARVWKLPDLYHYTIQTGRNTIKPVINLKFAESAECAVFPMIYQFMGRTW